MQCLSGNAIVHKKTLFFGPEQKYYYFVQKNCIFWGPCRNITIQEPGGAGFSCRAIFGVCADIFIFGEIFTSDMYPTPKKCTRTPLGVADAVLIFEINKGAAAAGNEFNQSECTSLNINQLPADLLLLTIQFFQLSTAATPTSVQTLILVAK